MARLTRKELKQDPFLSVYYDDFVEFAQNHYQKMIIVVAVIIIAVVAVVFWRRHGAQQEMAANTMLGQALATFHADVGASAQATPGAQTFADAQAKYNAALRQFTSIEKQYPKSTAGQIALYHIGLCQAGLGQESVALTTLQRASQSSDPGVAALAQFAQAGELEKSGQKPQAEALFRRLAEHPTTTVPAATAWLALAGAERQSNPTEARAIYQRVLKSLGSDSELVDAVKQQMATLNP